METESTDLLPLSAHGDCSSWQEETQSHWTQILRMAGRISHWVGDNQDTLNVNLSISEERCNKQEWKPQTMKGKWSLDIHTEQRRGWKKTMARKCRTKGGRVLSYGESRPLLSGRLCLIDRLHMPFHQLAWNLRLSPGPMFLKVKKVTRTYSPPWLSTSLPPWVHNK